MTETENRVAALEAQIADLQASQQNIVARLTQIRQEIEGSLDPMRAQQADRGEDLRVLQAEVNALRQQLLLIGEQITELALQAASQPQSGQAPAQPQTAVTGTPMPPPAQGAGAYAGAQQQQPAAGEQEAVFDAAFLDYMSGEYVLAIDGLEEFLRRFPESPRAAQAQYWIGESLAAQGSHGEARARFLELEQRYPTSDKVPDAKLRAALEAIELGQRQIGVAELFELIATHPGSDALLVGCMQLERMGEQLPPACRR